MLESKAQDKVKIGPDICQDQETGKPSEGKAGQIHDSGTQNKQEWLIAEYPRFPNHPLTYHPGTTNFGDKILMTGTTLSL